MENQINFNTFQSTPQIRLRHLQNEINALENDALRFDSTETDILNSFFSSQSGCDQDFQESFMPTRSYNGDLSCQISMNSQSTFESDSDSEDEETSMELRKQQLRAAAIEAIGKEFRCSRDECFDALPMAGPPMLQRQQACLYRETATFCCKCCGREEQSVICF
mmetsp:Transcript_30362/g.39189  ORF Transcript_30362/g.39189 Transcript_30362/m.39189 type:complete len:164 (-) Transcript_30362:260-751(-)|eukprot:CAMPEP_0117760556 /NCGR_PEP_ID=MMETSP0947-20121206/16700_1 /TAXON_ID=44440 /ORGANISM="Chattonella subsalsa, Strain CCMP2191" /LENGTH=163 /DNA_ID=CAMNT_0005581269 /DNA_START=181 /DNA_END=672 /DNA_ORIENTATION=+